jgi:2-methylisocitrate lyase-like PEP mutase family enzyme
MTVSQHDKAERFAAAHNGETPLLVPNPWDGGSAKLLETLGFLALATTSSGVAAGHARNDGFLGRDDVIAAVAAIVAATDLPVSADFENGFADAPADVAANATLLRASGVAGFSIEDYGRAGNEIYEMGFAAERVAAAADAAHGGDARLVITARAENFLHGRRDLDDTIARLQAYQNAGADVVFAPGITSAQEISAVVGAVDVPVNVIAVPGVPALAELAELGVARVSVGGAFQAVAYGAMVRVARELLAGDYVYFDAASEGRTFMREAFA